MFKLTEKKVYELNSSKGLFILTFYPIDLEKEKEGINEEYHSKIEQYKSRYDLEYKTSENSGFTSFIEGSYTTEEHTEEYILAHINYLIECTDFYNCCIELHKEELEVLEDYHL